MNAIAEQLRAAASGHPAATIQWPHRLLHDAADEIERLEAALAEIADGCMNLPPAHLEKHKNRTKAQIEAIARAALAKATA